MNSQTKALSHDAAKFWYEAWRYFESISLLAETLANQLSKDGYEPTPQSYNLKFFAYDPGDTRLVHDRLKNHWFGLFSIDDTIEDKENLQYGFGIIFGSNDPSSSVNPWIPVVYIFKAKMKEGAPWESWKHGRKLFSPSTVLSQANEGNHYILNLDVSNHSDIEYLKILRFPLGAIRSTDDVSRITKPSVEALRHDTESMLAGIEPYLLSMNDIWITEGS